MSIDPAASQRADLAAAAASLAAGVAPAPTSGATRAPGSDQAQANGRGARGADSVELSPLGLQLAQADAQPPGDATGAGDESDAEQQGNERASSGTGLRGADGEPLSREEEAQVRELQARDREVRAHEEAHKAAAGDLALSGPTYEYERGPDGRDYAVGGEVQISLRPGRTPEESVRNAQRARQAALAPAQPSGQDRQVAAQAAQMEAEAQREVAEKRSEEARGEGEDDENASAAEGADEAGQEPSLDQQRRDQAYQEVSQTFDTGTAGAAADLLGSLFG